MDTESLKFHYKFKIIDPRGIEESGLGEGVVRDVFCSFWGEFLISCTIGCNERVPSVRHDMGSREWEAVGRILLYGLKFGYFPLRISKVFMISALFGEGSLTAELIISAFKQYVNEEERESIENITKSFNDETEESFLETLSTYKCYKKLSKENVVLILKELGHQELIQKPKYIANSLYATFKKN